MLSCGKLSVTVELDCAAPSAEPDHVCGAKESDFLSDAV